jgi:hypothetical protein
MKQAGLYRFKRGGKRDFASFFDPEEHARDLPADIGAAGTRQRMRPSKEEIGLEFGHVSGPRVAKKRPAQPGGDGKTQHLLRNLPAIVSPISQGREVDRCQASECLGKGWSDKSVIGERLRRLPERQNDARADPI